MPYVNRDTGGSIIGTFANPQTNAAEYLEDDNPDVLAFVAAHSAAEAIAMRRSEYQLRSDPLFFKWQRGEASEQDWRSEVAAIQAAIPGGAQTAKA